MEPAVPREEIEQRLRAFQAALRADGVAGAVVVQSTDLYYLAGTAQSAHLGVPAAGEPALLVRKTLERAQEESPLERIEPLRSLRDLAGALSAAGVEGGRIGFELDVLPAARYLDYRRRLDGYELVDCSAALVRLRTVKSPWELDRIREASAMLAGVADCVAGVLREGMTEIELAAEIEAWLRRQRHQGIVRMRAFNGEVHYGTIAAGPAAAAPGGTDTPLVGAGPNAAVAKGASPRPIGRGEPVIVDLVGALDGYLSDQTRTFCLGPAPAKLREAYDVACRILHEVAASARPGVPASRLYDLANELAGDLRECFASHERVSFVGHGFGLEIDEPPYLARSFERAARRGHGVRVRAEVLLPRRGRGRGRELVRGHRGRRRAADERPGGAARAVVAGHGPD